MLNTIDTSRSNFGLYKHMLYIRWTNYKKSLEQKLKINYLFII